MTAPKRSALFITLEGGEGGGKSTLSKGLQQALRARGEDGLFTREPGGAPGADEIRALLVEGGAERWSPLEETLLFMAARANHVRETIAPALKRGQWVICDRFTDSTRAYQSAAGGVSADLVDRLSAIIAAPRPDLTLILDLDPSLGLKRASARHHNEDRFEKKPSDFHQRVRAEFLAIAKAEPERCVVLDAAQSPEAVLAQALAAIDAKAARA